jgi:hypothetical protein
MKYSFWFKVDSPAHADRICAAHGLKRVLVRKLPQLTRPLRVKGVQSRASARPVRQQVILHAKGIKEFDSEAAAVEMNKVFGYSQTPEVEA